MTNPEDSVISSIEALIDESLATGPVDDYSVDRYDKCLTCRGSWHGLPHERNGCPGAYARGYAKREWKRQREEHKGWGRSISDLDGHLRTLVFHQEDHRIPPQGSISQEMIDQLRWHLRHYPEDRERLIAHWGTGWLPINPAHREDWLPWHRSATRCLQCACHLEYANTYSDSTGHSPLCQECFTSRERVRGAGGIVRRCARCGTQLLPLPPAEVIFCHSCAQAYARGEFAYEPVADSGSHRSSRSEPLPELLGEEILTLQTWMPETQE